MRLLAMIRYFLRSVLSGRRMDEDLDEELRDHLEREARAREARGATTAEARRGAAVALGGVTRYAEAARDARGWRWWRDALTDLRHAARLLHRYPGFSSAVILITAVGIGAVTVVFSAVHGVLIRPLPFAAPQQLALVNFTGGDGRYAGSGLNAFVPLAEQTGVIANAGVYAIGGAVLVHNGEPEHVRVEYLTPAAMQLLGRGPMIGRLFTQADADRDEPVVVLSHAFWQDRFGGDSSIVGRGVTVDGVTSTVIGVMPPDFLGPRLLGPMLWQPARLSGGQLLVNGQRRLGGSILVRLRDGVSPEQAAAILTPRLHPRVLDPVSGDSVTGRVRVESVLEVVLLDRRGPLLILLAAVGFVLLLVAATIATLALARMAARRRELTLRGALGAGRGRQVRQVLTETMLLMSIGGALGVALAAVGLRLFVNAGVSVLPRVRDIRIDWPVLAVAAALTLASGVLAGVAPAIMASRAAVGEAFKGMSSTGSPRRATVRSALVAIEIAVSVVLLVGAGLLIKGFMRVAPTAPGFAADHRVVMSVTLRDVPGDAVDSAAAHRRFVATAEQRIAAVPGVRAVAVSTVIPLTGISMMFPVQPDGGVPTRKYGHQRAVSPDYLAAMRIPLISGRGLTDRDGEGDEPVAIVNQSAAARWWPGQQPIGKLLHYGRSGGIRGTVRVVGVARDVRFDGTDTTHVAEFYVPYAQFPYRMVNFLVVTASDPHRLIPDLKRQLWAVDPGMPIDQVGTLDTIVGDSVKEARLYLTMMTIFAGIALLLATAGIFSVVAYAVSQRTREIGIRLALGAPQFKVGALVVRQGAATAAVGLLVGVVAARGLTRFMQSLLLEVSPTDAGVFIATLAGLGLVVLLACIVPMRRALGVDPVASLRVE